MHSAKLRSLNTGRSRSEAVITVDFQDILAFGMFVQKGFCRLPSFVAWRSKSVGVCRFNKILENGAIWHQKERFRFLVQRLERSAHKISQQERWIQRTGIVF